MPKLLGEITIYEQNLEMNVYVYREGLIEHLALLGGINLFWIIVFKLILTCYKRNMF